jgi:hypothetical protein
MTMIRNILIITIIAALVPTANVSASASTEIALFSSDSDSLSISGNSDNAIMELKATNENGKTKKVSDFQMNADNVLYIKAGEKVTVKDKVDFTKAITTDGNNNQKIIGITSNGVIDFTGYTQGVSTLDVVVDDDRAYEAIIVIGQQTKEVVDKEITRVNNKYVMDISFKTVLKFPGNGYDDKCSSKLGSAGLDYPYDYISQCQKEEYDQCEEDEANGLPETDKCDEYDERFFDDCEGFANQHECDEHWNTQPVDKCEEGYELIDGRCEPILLDPGWCPVECPPMGGITPVGPEAEPEAEPEPNEGYIVDEGDLDEQEAEEEDEEESNNDEEIEDQDVEEEEEPEEEDQGESEEESNEGEESDDSGETSE